MALSAGTRLGPYEVVSAIGAGGMGEVYRARDTRLARDVALKVLPDSVVASVDQLARFRREALVLATLNHPNVAAIYGLEESESGGVRALVMELVEGIDLRDAIRGGRFTGTDGLAEVRAVAVQIASGLEAAHEAGVVHRDLKPANIRIRPDGTVKVLDFGLAKAADSERAGLGEDSPTMTSPAVTQAGVILGTAAYMSPEQARGRPVDRRADVWAFGCVLLEMLTGAPAFRRDTVTDTLAAITRDEPDWNARPDLPPDISYLLRRCLDKNPRSRLRDIGEARITLAGADREGAEPPWTGGRPGSQLPRARTAAWAVSTALLVSGASVATWWTVSRPAAGPVVSTIFRMTADSGLTTSPAVAPNGSLLAYASDRGGGTLNIWVQALPDGSPIQVTFDEADASEPHFSADGSRIVYRSERDGGGLYIVPALGGPPRLIVAKGHSARFSPDGKSIAYVVGGRGVGSQLWIIDDAGGSPRRLAADLGDARRPVWSPNGKSMVVAGERRTADTRTKDWWLVSVETGESWSMGAGARLDRAGLDAGASSWVGNQLFYSAPGGDATSVWVVDLTSDGRTLAGPPRRLTAGAGQDLAPTVLPSADGLVIYYGIRDLRANIHRLSLAGAPGLAGLERVTDSAAQDSWPSVSADGRTLVFESNRSSGPGAWLRDLTSGREKRLTVAGSGRYPTISPDATSVAYVMTSGNSSRVVIRDVEGGAIERLPEGITYYTWSWRIRDVLLSGKRTGIVNELVAVDPRTRQARPVLAGLADQGFYSHGQMSPDHRWISVTEFVNADRARIVLLPFRETAVRRGEWLPLTDDQAVEEEHVWSAAGDAIYFVSGRDGTRCLWRRRLDRSTGRPTGSVESVLHLHGFRRSVISSALQPQRIALAADALYFSVEEARGNIWRAAITDR